MRNIVSYNRTSLDSDKSVDWLSLDFLHIFQGTMFILVDWIGNAKYFLVIFPIGLVPSNHIKIFRKKIRKHTSNSFLLSFAAPFIVWIGFGCICLQHLLRFLYRRELKKFDPGQEDFFLIASYFNDERVLHVFPVWWGKEPKKQEWKQDEELFFLK